MRGPSRRSRYVPYTTLFRSKAGEILGVACVTEVQIEGDVSRAVDSYRQTAHDDESYLRVGERDERPLEVDRSEEHTSELQSQSNIVCRLLLEKKKFNNDNEL